MADSMISTSWGHASKDSWENKHGKKRFSVSDFIRKVTPNLYLCKFYYEILETNNLEEEFLSKSPTQKGYTEVEKLKLRDAFFYSKGITLPSRGLNTDQYLFPNGFRIETPTGTNYGDGNVAIPMIADDRYAFYDFFTFWMNKIHSKETGFFGFYDDYIADIAIRQLRSTTEDRRSRDDDVTDGLNAFHEEMSAGAGNWVYGVILKNAFPKAISAVTFAHDAKEQVSFEVNFAYEGIDYIRPS
jgi:hypothetical protein